MSSNVTSTHRQKLAAAAAKLYPVLEAKEEAVAEKREDEAVECIDLDRVRYVSDPQTKDGLRHAVRPTTVKELAPSAYQPSKQSKTQYSSSAVALPDLNCYRRITRFQLVAG